MTETIYFDYNATTLLRKEVQNLILSMPLIPYNCSSIHRYGRESKKILSDARSKISSLLNLSDQYQIIFTSSGTEANNLALKNLEDKVIITSPTEHLSVLNSLERANHEILEVSNNGIINLKQYEKLLSKYQGKAIVSLMIANNETGIIQDIKLLTQLAHKYDCLFHTDAVQAFGKMPIDIEDLNVDFITLSSHKIGGPLGAAALIYKKSINIKPLINGGGQEQNLRAGTENLSSILGFAKAVELTLGELDSYYNHTSTIIHYLETNIEAISKEVVIIGKNIPKLSNTLCFTMPNVSSYIQVINFDLEGFAVSAGSACSSGKIKASHVLSSMGYPEEIGSSAIRVSIGLNNTLDEAKLFIKKWKEIYNRLSIKNEAA